jgi:hypothetical protein
MLALQADLYYSVDADFAITPKPSSHELAHAILQKDYLNDGWDKLYIYANAQVSPLQQHQAAGFLEGYATYAEIHAAYNNFVKLDFEGQPYAPA